MHACFSLKEQCNPGYSWARVDILRANDDEINTTIWFYVYIHVQLSKLDFTKKTVGGSQREENFFKMKVCSKEGLGHYRNAVEGA